MCISIKASILCWHRSRNVSFLYWYGDCLSSQCIWKNHMWDVLALENEKTDCSGFSWIVSIMVNGFSKCQSNCFIDLASQRGEQTHLDGILLTAKTPPPNQEEMWISLCPFMIHIPPNPISDRSFPQPPWCISITPSVTVYLSDLGCWQPLMFSLIWFPHYILCFRLAVLFLSVVKLNVH